jgi:hypothetical protein
MCASLGAYGQNARFFGHVIDSSGAAIPDAMVQVVNQDTGVVLSATTDKEGDYSVPYLAAGRYQIVIQAPGFNQSVRNVLLQMGQAAINDVQLGVQSEQTNVTVEGGAATVTQVETENTEVSGTITGKEVTGLQLNGRNFSQLIALAPGVSNQTSQDEARVGMAGSVSYSVNGGRIEYNSFQVDGSEILNVGINKDHTSLIVTPSIDAIQEIKILTSNYEELVRGDHAFTSKEYLTVRYIHDEWNETAPVPQYATVVNSFPTIRNNFEGPGTSVIARLDSQLSAKLSNELAFGYTSSNVSLKDVAAPHVYLSRTNAIDSGMGYIFNNGAKGTDGVPKVPGIDIAGTNAAYGGNGFSVDPGYMPWTHSNPDYSVMDNVEKTLGRHSLKFGVQFIFFNRAQTNGLIGAATGDVQGLMTFDGGVTGNSFADFLMIGAGGPGDGSLSLGGITSFQQDSGQGTYHQSYRIIEPYFQDDWKVTPRLTLNAGVRLSLFGVYKETHHNAYNWTEKAFSPALSESVFVAAGTGQLTNTASNTPTSINLKDGKTVNPVVANGIEQCGVNGVPDGCMTGHLWNPAPRIGFARDVLGNGKMAVRAGYGVFFEHGTADEANTGSLEGGAPPVLSMTQYDVARSLTEA